MTERSYHTNFECCRKCGYTWESVTPDDEDLFIPKCPKCQEKKNIILAIDEQLFDQLTAIRWFYSRLHPENLRHKGYNCSVNEALTLQSKTEEIINILKGLQNE